MLRTRRVGTDLRVIYGDSCDLVVELAGTGREVLRIGREEGARWALGPRGESLWRWKPGTKPVVRTLAPTREVITLAWALPADAAAFAAGDEVLAVRRGETTILLGLDGKAIEEERLPPWSEGVVEGARFHFLLPGDPQAGRAESCSSVTLDLAVRGTEGGGRDAGPPPVPASPGARQGAGGG